LIYEAKTCRKRPKAAKVRLVMMYSMPSKFAIFVAFLRKRGEAMSVRKLSKHSIRILFRFRYSCVIGARLETRLGLRSFDLKRGRRMKVNISHGRSK
jgi:L-cystine uptake protein TcyP (sodium:dicarboxylate symporter family)